MPAMNGGDVARELCQARPGACVLYMSGYAAPVMTEQGLLDPGVAIVNKPFTRDELLNTLEATLSRQPPREKL
jgi:FixJ family two-component response regulator